MLNTADPCHEHGGALFQFVCSCSPYVARCDQCLETGHDHREDGQHVLELADHVKDVRRQWVQKKQKLLSVRERLAQASAKDSPAAGKAAYRRACDDVNRTVDSLKHKLEAFRREALRKLRQVYECDGSTGQSSTQLHALQESLKSTDDLLEASRAAFRMSSASAQLRAFGAAEQSWQAWKEAEESRDAACEQTMAAAGKLEQRLASVSAMRPLQVALVDVESPLEPAEVSDDYLLQLYGEARQGTQRGKEARRVLASHQHEGHLLAAALHTLSASGSSAPVSPSRQEAMALLVPWLLAESARGSRAARVALGRAHWVGLGVEKNEVEAVKYFRLAADQGDADAQNMLGACLAKGRGVTKDEEEAVKYFRLADSQAELGSCLVDDGGASAGGGDGGYGGAAAAAAARALGVESPLDVAEQAQTQRPAPRVRKASGKITADDVPQWAKEAAEVFVQRALRRGLLHGAKNQGLSYMEVVSKAKKHQEGADFKRYVLWWMQNDPRLVSEVRDGKPAAFFPAATGVEKDEVEAAEQGDAVAQSNVGDGQAEGTGGAANDLP